jgi:hypothetical protein
MKPLLRQRTHLVIPTALVLLIMLFIPLTSHAASYDYSYTAPAFTTINSWSGIPSSLFPGIGDKLTIQFTLQEPLAQALVSNSYLFGITQVTMTAGSISLTNPTSYMSWSNMTLGSDGLPTIWSMLLSTQTDIGVPYYTLSSSNNSTSFLYNAGSENYANNYGIYVNLSSGTWSVSEQHASVPLPATMILFGSGLIGLVRFKNKIKK